MLYYNNSLVQSFFADPTPWRSFPGHHIFFTPACYAAGLPWE